MSIVLSCVFNGSRNQRNHLNLASATLQSRFDKFIKECEHI